ncbi:hypothetical protein O3P69_015296 [Scylla paramamosain]|uniref:Uncharacterized protein n=1 Tax=Scylla paramamosain TaxID=85552 RepID=A0AAW0T3M3_SCYPA
MTITPSQDQRVGRGCLQFVNFHSERRTRTRRATPLGVDGSRSCVFRRWKCCVIVTVTVTVTVSALTYDTVTMV